jgi:hypothetical protein
MAARGVIVPATRTDALLLRHEARYCLLPAWTRAGADASTAAGCLVRPLADFGYPGGLTSSRTRAVGGLVIPDRMQEVAVGPDHELLGVVVHSGLVLGRRKDVVAALRRITAFPTGLVLDTVVLARDINAQAAGRRQHAATAHRQAAATAQRKDEAAAQHDSQVAAQREGAAAAGRQHAVQQARIERRYLPSFDEGDVLRLGITTPTGAARWLDAYASSSSETEDHYRLEAAYWLTPLPIDGLLTLVCSWPEIGLPETRTDIILPDLAVRAAATFPLWDAAEDAEA